MKPISGNSVWMFFALSIVVVFIYLLANVSKCESVEFCATSIFFTIFIGSLVMTIFLSVLSISMTGKLHVGEVKFFFMQDFTIRKLLWIPLGLVGVFVASYIGILVNEPLLSIFLSGIVMLVALYHTKVIIIPILIHGFYNASVVMLRSGVGNSFIDTILQNSPINVPNLGQISGLGSEIIFQILLVAVAEEMFKVFIIEFILVGTRGKFDVKSSLMTWVAGGVSVLLWTTYHSISAIR